jgi:hypothetical protein
MNFLILSSLPNLLSVPYVSDDTYHTAIIVGATTSSVLWHTFPYSSFLYSVDSIFGVTWYLYEMNLAFTYDCPMYICKIYWGVFLVHMTTELLSYNGFASYALLHTILHLLTAVRAIHIASFFYKEKSIDNNI